MIKIRLKRIGVKHSPFYRVVVSDVRKSLSGKYIEQIGTYDPLKNAYQINKELAIKWLNNGAQMTPTVKKLFSQEKILEQIHQEKLAKKKAKSVKK